MRDLINILEEKQTISLNPLKYGRKELQPAISEKTINYHYGKLAKAYVDKFNAGQGDSDFMYAGAVLHNLYFSQFKKPSFTKPTGSSLELITEKFKTFDSFKEQFTEEAMSIKGSGWAYLDKKGNIRSIANHQTKTNVAFIVDMWEHSWALDYEHKKDQYLKNIWRIIDWDVINQRLA